MTARSWCPSCRDYLLGGEHFEGRACGTCHTLTIDPIAALEVAWEALDWISAETQETTTRNRADLALLQTDYAANPLPGRAANVEWLAQAAAMRAVLEFQVQQFPCPGIHANINNRPVSCPEDSNDPEEWCISNRAQKALSGNAGKQLLEAARRLIRSQHDDLNITGCVNWVAVLDDALTKLARAIGEPIR